MGAIILSGLSRLAIWILLACAYFVILGSASAWADSGAKEISVGWSSSCLLQNDGKVLCWGDNSAGQLGNGTTDPVSPGQKVEVAGLSNVTHLAGSCVLTDSGAVKCWEAGDGVLYTLVESGAVAVDNSLLGNTCVVMSSGAVRCKGSFVETAGQSAGQLYSIPGISGATQVSVGIYHVCAVATGGTVKCWGNNIFGAVGNGQSGFGATVYGNAVTVPGVSGATKVQVGMSHSCALLSSGEVKCWGSNVYGTLGNGTTNNSYTPVSVNGIQNAEDLQSGLMGSCVLISGGLKCWGVSYSEMSRWMEDNFNNPDSASISSYDTEPVVFSGLSGISSISSSSGVAHNCAIVTGGIVRCWGLNYYGQLGDGTTNSSNTPVSPFGLPAPRIIRQPSNPMAAPDTVLEWESADGADVQCSLDDVEYFDCNGASPIDLADASPGSYTIYIKQTVNGETSPPAQVSFVVEGSSAQTPEPPSIQQPEAYSNDNNIDISFSGNEGAGFECSLDNGSYSPCSSPFSTGVLADGEHQLSVRQTVSGLTGDSASVSWAVDTTPPDPPTASGAPDPWTSSTSVSISFTGEPGAIFTCIIDGQSVSACSSPHLRTSLSQGNHSLTVQQIDQAGNVSAPNAISWTVDTTSPAAPVLSGSPSAFTNSTSQNISWTAVADTGGQSNAGTGILRYECSQDNGAWSTCTSPRTRSGLTEGAKSLRVRAVDRAGNTGSEATASWTVDTTSPAAPVLSGAPSAFTNSTSQNVSWAAVSDSSGILRYECSQDNGAWSTCISPRTRTAIAQGARSLRVRAVDGAGNTGPLVVATWTVDTTAPPTPTLTGAPPVRTKITSQNIAWAAVSDSSGILRYECSQDNEAWSTCASPQARSSIADGARSLRVRAVDRAENLSSVASSSWTVDNTGPSAPVLSGAPGAYSRTSSQGISWSAPSDLSGILRYECSSDGGSYVPCISPQSRTGLSEGDHSFAVRAIDLLGNVGTASTASWKVDTQAPSAPVLAGAPTAYTNSTSQNISWESLSDPAGIDRYECSQDGGAYQTCTSPQTRSGLISGARSLAVRAVDGAGNTSGTAYVSWSVSTSLPTLSWSKPLSPTSSTTLSYSLNFSKPVSINLSSEDFIVAGTANSGSSWTVSSLSATNAAGGYASQWSLVIQAEASPNGTLYPVLLAARAVDRFGNQTALSNGQSVQFDSSAQSSLSSAEGSVYIPGTTDGVNGIQVYADLNNNMAKDSDEPVGTSGNDGVYSLVNLPRGSYRIRLNPATGQSCLLPGSTNSFNPYPCSTPLIDWNGGAQSRDLYAWKNTAVVSGTLYSDSNRNNSRDGKETWAAATLYQDIDGNGLFTPGEPTGASNGANGTWAITGVAGVAAAIRVVGAVTTPESGYPQDVPAANGISSLLKSRTVASDLGVGYGFACGLSGTDLLCWNNAVSGGKAVVNPGQTALVSSGVSQFDTGRGHACMIKTDSTLWCVGSNSNSQLGNGSDTDSSSAVQVSNLSGDPSQISVGAYHSCALLAGGQVQCWGGNDSGKSLPGSQADPVSSPQTVDGISSASRVSSGGSHSCALVANGQVQCWGGDQDGQLGDGAASSSGSVVPVTGITGATQIATGNSHSCALMGNATVRCWGSNQKGQLGDTSYTDRSSPVAVQGLSNVSDLQAKGDHSCALLGSGEVRCWGEYFWGGGDDRSSLVTDPAPGGVFAYNRPVSVIGLSSVSSMALGESDICAQRSGTWVCLGDNYTGWNTTNYLNAPVLQSTGTATAFGSIGIAKSVSAPSISNPPSAKTPIASSSVNLKFNAPAGTRLVCWVDDTEPVYDFGESSGDCSNISYSRLENGYHSAVAYALDLKSGMVVSAPRIVSWSVDVVNPSAPSLSSALTAGSAPGTRAVSISGEQGASFSCQVNDGDWRPCSALWYVGGLLAGSHQLKVRQTDTAGNTSSSASLDVVVPSQQAPALSAAIVGNRLSCSSPYKPAKGQTGFFAWFNNGVQIATGNKLTVTDSTWGNSIYCVQFITTPNGLTSYSSAAWNQGLPLPRLVSNAKLAKRRSQLVCSPGKWMYGPIGFEYTWKLNGETLAGATGTVYTWNKSMVGKTVSCEITATNPSGSTKTIASIALT